MTFTAMTCISFTNETFAHTEKSSNHEMKPKSKENPKLLLKSLLIN